ncbi:MAG: hypothetical protein EU530_08140 [Promethearchaeota archaeon]|nr:MAG: hypothetical protein EU530_08140 [Candidatus Lokiarchaeota archaeon]
MTTTIQIDNDTKKNLFRIKLKLEEHKGKPITYNELIQYLIEGHSSRIIRGAHLMDFRKLKGTWSQDEVNIFYKERKKDLEKEEKIAPLN